MIGIGSAGELSINDSTIDNFLDELGMIRSQISEIHDVVFDDIEKARIFLQISQAEAYEG